MDFYNMFDAWIISQQAKAGIKPKPKPDPRTEDQTNIREILRRDHNKRIANG